MKNLEIEAGGDSGDCIVRRLDREADELLAERDMWQEKSEKLAGLIEKHFCEDFGEFSNCNDPVERAIDFLSNVRDHRCLPDGAAGAEGGGQ
jgi:hypothetical protein